MATQTITLAEAINRAGRGDFDWHLSTIRDIQQFEEATLQAVRGEPDILPIEIFAHSPRHPGARHMGHIRWDGERWDTTGLECGIDAPGEFSYASF